MNVEEFAQVANGLRPKLVKLTVVRGHEHDDAEDIVHESIIKCLGSASKCRTKSDVEKLLRTVSFRESANHHKEKAFRSSVVSRLDDRDEDGEIQEALLHDDQAEQRDLKIDVQRALSQLSKEDREIARYLFIEGWTYEEIYPLFVDLFTSKTEMYRHVHASILPVLRTSLAAYKGRA